jgi:hypothetical protein
MNNESQFSLDKEKRAELRKSASYKHIFLNSDSALRVLDDALGVLVSSERQLARSEGFEACTQYWKDVVRSILKDSDCDTSAFLTIIKAFHLDKNKGDQII